VSIIKIIERILRERSWAIYDRQNPVQKLNLQGEAPLFKVNEVEIKYLKAEIEQKVKEEEWKSSNSDGSQENTSQNG
jgi:hypothetical protein